MSKLNRFEFLLYIDSDEDPAKIREQVEYALNEACSALESRLKHDCISYALLPKVE